MAWAATPFILLFFWLALNSLVWDSPTMDEQNHLARGLAFLHTGDPRLSLEHPPLVNSISALPLLTMPEVELPLDDPSWQRQPPDVYWYWFADKLLWHTNQDIDHYVERMIFLARLPVVFLTLGLALTGFHFAREAWGRRAALPAFLLLLFEPNVLANGRYITTDLGGAFFLFLAVYLLWRLWCRDGWSWRHWLWAALGLGLAFGSKLSTLVFVPILAATAVLPLYSCETGDKPSPELEVGELSRTIEGRGGFDRLSLRWRGWFKRLAQFLTAGLFSIWVVWAIFGFEWGPFWFSDDRLLFLNQFSGPMPTFWAGIAKIADLGSGGRGAFLNGTYSADGFVAYFPTAFMVKTPLVILLLLGLAAVVLLWREETRRTAVFLLILPLCYFLFSLTSGLNIGYRHLLPMLPFLLILISGLTTPGKKVADGKYAIRNTHYVLWAGIAILMATTLWIHPHYLSYFNLLAGGPNGGRDILVDSNVDWGQDLLRLRAWQVENDVDLLKLGYFGSADPAYFGLEFEPLPGFPRPEFYSLWSDPPFDPAAPGPGVYAISVSSLWESHSENKNVYPWFRNRQPDDQIGYSILIYRVP